MPLMKRLRILLLASCTTALAADPAKPIPFSAALEAGRIHEECARLEAGEKRNYHWKADAPVDFNIHFHRGNDVTYPVKRTAMRGDGGTFVARTGEDYCWMWTAREKPAKVTGAITPG